MRYLRGMLLVSALLAGSPAFAAAGRIEASWDVSANGAPQYTIPIRMTEGINGLTPRFAISHAAGERSILGVGFVLAGLSAIAPCRKTLDQDGAAAAPRIESGDRYCLDGARLRVVSGTYGALNSVYRTEIDQLTRITVMQVNTFTSTPVWFKVESRDGLVYEYGNSEDSKLTIGAGNYVRAVFWAVNRISDRSGNSIRFEYDTDSATKKFRPKFVHYTDKESTQGSAKYRVKFNYQLVPRPDPVRENLTSGLGGAGHVETELLASIELQHLEASYSTYREYRFTYQAGAGTNSRLRTVEECGTNGVGTICLPTTTFDWNPATSGYATSVTVASVAAGVPLDFNGDGFEDYAWAAGGYWHYSKGSASGLEAPVSTGTPVYGGAPRALDWNGDGRMDLLIGWSDNKFRVLVGTTTGFAAPVHAGSGGIPSNTANSDWLIVDINADGYDDLLRIRTNSTVELYVRLGGSTGLGSETLAMSSGYLMSMGSGFLANAQVYAMSTVRRPDFNGDGRTDLVLNLCEWDWEFNYCVWWGFYYLMATPTGNGYEVISNIPDALGGAYPKYGDFNADGLTDIAYLGWSWGLWCMGFGQGGGGLVVSCGPAYSGYYGQPTMTADYDGDGYDDFLVASTSSPSTWHVLRSTGVGITPAGTAINTGIQGTLSSAWQVGDFNGDGLADLGAVNTSSSTWSMHAHQGIPGDRLQKATDGLGNQVAFDYLPMTNPDIYSKNSSASYPQRDYQTAAQLARSMTITPAGAGSYSLTYSYSGARSQTRGRGQLGMVSRTIEDSRNGVKVVETYRQDFPYVGALAGATSYQPGGSKIIESVAHEYNMHTLNGTQYNERYLPFRWRSTSNRREVAGNLDNQLITEVIDTRTVNTLGNTTLAEMRTFDRDPGSLEPNYEYKTSIAATYNEDQTNWCLSVPTSRAETRTLPDLSSQTRTTQWTVSACKVTKETIEPNAGSLVSLVTDLAYDSCGNVASLTSYPAGVPGESRATTISHGSRCQLPETITNPEGHQTGIEYDWRLGAPAAYTDPNEFGQSGAKKTFIAYDALGRESRVTRKDGTATQTDIFGCDAGGNWCGKNDDEVRLRITRTERNTQDAVLRTDEEFLDGFGRERFSHVDSLESGHSMVETRYDALGRPSQRSQPYFGGQPVYWTLWQRDLLGRVTQETAPGSRITSWNHAGRKVEITDPLNMTIARRHSVLDQLLRIEEPSPGGHTNHSYWPFGELKTVKDAANNLTQWNVNVRGFVDSTSDPDSGTTTFEVNAFGETRKIRDAKTAAPNWTTQFTFDKLSRPLTRLEAEGTTTFIWGSQASEKNIGRLKYVTSPGSYSEYFYFDEYGRLHRQNVNADGGTYDVYLNYHATTGLLNEVTYPASTGTSPLKIKHEYANNLLKRVKNADSGLTYWEAVSTNAFGDYHDEVFGNNVKVFRQFNPGTGEMTARTGGVGGYSGLLNVELDWRADGNLNYRRDLIQSPSVTEQFYYDGIHRFDRSTLNGVTNEDVTLDAAGNITWKLGVGSFAYTGAQSGCTYGHAHSQPRAVRNAGGTVYCYDANGNMTKRAGESISYASYNLPILINAPGGSSSALSYGAFRNRYKQVATSGGTSETTIYVAGLLEKVTRTGQPTEYRHVIQGGNGTAAIHIRRSNGTSDTYYIHQDHLGSPELITGNGGSVVVRASFSAYGERRDDDHDGAIPAGELALLAGVTRRGFTGHEHLDGVGLIHMNGRVYDPRIGRFLGADPIVVAGHSQGANPYGYVWNNPLRYTDPSGFFVVGERPQDVPTGPATIGGGRIWSPFLLEVYFTGVFRSWPWYTPSASPPSAPYESPGMVLPKEGRATFNPYDVGPYGSLAFGQSPTSADVDPRRGRLERDRFEPKVIEDILKEIHEAVQGILGHRGRTVRELAQELNDALGSISEKYDIEIATRIYCAGERGCKFQWVANPVTDFDNTTVPSLDRVVGPGKGYRLAAEWHSHAAWSHTSPKTDVHHSASDIARAQDNRKPSYVTQQSVLHEYEPATNRACNLSTSSCQTPAKRGGP